MRETAKFPNLMSRMPTTPAANNRTMPMAMTRSTPQALIRWPVKKLGTNMASTCHCKTHDASNLVKPQPIMATGAAVIMKFIMA